MVDQFTELELALPLIRTLEDCGIMPLHYFRVFARCSTHDVIQTVWDSEPMDNDRVICGQCVGFTRKCKVFAFTECGRPDYD